MKAGKLNPQGDINFDGFEEILDFTSDGSESSVSVSVDGDTDKEYKIVMDVAGAEVVRLTMNGNTTASSYGYQYLQNYNGAITAGRAADDASILFKSGAGLLVGTILTPTGLIKTSFSDYCTYTSGTSITHFLLWGKVFNSTSNITLLTFATASGNFTAGTRITVYARRSR